MMDLSNLARTLQRKGIVLVPANGRLRAFGRPDVLTPRVQAIIRQYAAPLYFRLTVHRWLHRGDRVHTPRGAGTVLQVFAHRVTVQLDGARHADAFEPEAVHVFGTARAA